MKKKLLTFIFGFILLVGLPSPVASQQQTERWICLNAAAASGHTARLTTRADVKPIAFSDTYIVTCVGTNSGQICTTGKAETDMIVYKKNNLAELERSTGFKFEGLFADDDKTSSPNPVKSKAGGNLDPLRWRDSTLRGQQRRFFTLNYWDSVQPARGSVGGEQQGTLEYETLERACASLSWDPYGRVFDSQNLEPVLGVSVSLQKKRENNLFTKFEPWEKLGGALENPQATREDGLFNFVVPDGIYRLAFSSADYTFPVADLSQINPNHTKIYADLYPLVNGRSTGEEINQQGEIQHRDVPVSPKGASVVNPPKLMEYFYEAKPVAGKVVVSGRTSHPFTKITAYTVNSQSKARLHQVASLQADKMGKFDLELDQTKFAANEEFGEVDLEKVDLRQLAKGNLSDTLLSFLNRFIKVSHAQAPQSTTIKFDPIPSYLEGYAYDTAGTVLPNATIGVYLTFSNKPTYETKADEQGYFKVSSEYLPPFPYQLKYTNPAGISYQVTTSKFITQNAKFIESKKTDLYSFKNKDGQVFKPTPEPLVTTKKEAPSSAVSPTTLPGQSTSLIIIVAILILLIASATVLLSFYYLKKKTAPEDTPNQ